MERKEEFLEMGTMENDSGSFLITIWIFILFNFHINYWSSSSKIITPLFRFFWFNEWMHIMFVRVCGSQGAMKANSIIIIHIGCLMIIINFKYPDTDLIFNNFFSLKMKIMFKLFFLFKKICFFQFVPSTNWVILFNFIWIFFVVAQILFSLCNYLNESM